MGNEKRIKQLERNIKLQQSLMVNTGANIEHANKNYMICVERGDSRGAHQWMCQIYGYSSSHLKASTKVGDYKAELSHLKSKAVA